jgi:hypothetical protein
MEDFQYLVDWYRGQCNGVWEHQQGVNLQSLDNPGWLLKVDLVGTNLEHSPFQPLSLGVSNDGDPIEASWMKCQVQQGQFTAACSPDMLDHALETFQLWSSLYAN